MKTLQYILYFIFTDVCFFALYFFTEDIILSLIISLLAILLVYRIIVPNYLKANHYLKSVDQTNQFINGFIVQLSVTPSIDESLQAIKSYCSLPIKSIIEDAIYQTGWERIEQISYNLNHPLMYVFSQQLKIYNEQGGDILCMSKQMIEQVNHLKSSVHLLSSVKNRKLREFSIVWLFSLGSLLYLRLGLENYYKLVLTESDIFRYAIGLSFVILFISYAVFYMRFGDYYMEKGWD